MDDCLIINTSDPLDVLVLRPKDCPRASAKDNGLSVIAILEGFVTSPNK